MDEKESRRIPIGTLVIAKRDAGMVCSVGELGVCYEHYELEGRLGHSFIFEEGGYDGFNPDDIELVLDVTDVVLPSLANYVFENVMVLKDDFRSGRFAEAFFFHVGEA